jgi:hypothetical protein
MPARTYAPAPGDAVRIRRWKVPCPELPGIRERKLAIEYEGTIATVRELAGGHLITLQGDPEPIFTGSQHTGQGEGASWTFQTEIVPLAGVPAHDLAAAHARVEAAQVALTQAQQRWEACIDSTEAARTAFLRASEQLGIAQRAADEAAARLAAARHAAGEAAAGRDRPC